MSPDDLAEHIAAEMPVLMEDLRDIDLRGFELGRAMLVQCNLANQDLSQTGLDGAMLTDCDLTGVRMGTAARRFLRPLQQSSSVRS
jgi:uncharacterized protein YjbI with pentapeptide repeats